MSVVSGKVCYKEVDEILLEYYIEKLKKAQKEGKLEVKSYVEIEEIFDEEKNAAVQIDKEIIPRLIKGDTHIRFRINKEDEK